MFKETSTLSTASSFTLSRAVVHPQYDPLRLLSRRNQARKPFPQRLGVEGLPWRGSAEDPIGIYTVSTFRNGARFNSRRSRCFELASAPTLHMRTCVFRVPNGGFYNRDELPLFGNESCTSRQLGSKHSLHFRTQAFNPRSGGGGGGPGRTILNLAGAAFLTYLTVTGRLDWLFDTILALWLLSAVLWWFVERSLVKGPCPNCGGEFQVLEFTLKEEYRLCPYCSQPFKLENKRFVRDEPRFSNQQGRGFNQPFGGFGGFGDFGRPSSSRNKEDSSGVIVDVEAEVRDKD